MSNLLERTLSSVVIVLVTVIAVIVYPPVFPACVLLVLCSMMLEFFRMSIGKGLLPEKLLSVLTGIAAFCITMFATYGTVDWKWLAVCIFPVIAIALMPVFRNDRAAMDKLPYIYTALVYIALPVSLLPLIVYRHGEHSGWLLMCFFIIIWVGDVGAYALGTAFGQRPGARKLAPAISPKKSWWGLAGSIMACAGASLILYYLGWLSMPVVHCLVLALIISIGGVLGDLVESMWKRKFGVKDAGTFIPGHGGFLDRFDSSLVAIPLACAYLEIFSLI